MIQTDEQMLLAQQNVANLRQILLQARKVHSPEDYSQLAKPILVEIQQREQELLVFLSGGQRKLNPDHSSAPRFEQDTGFPEKQELTATRVLATYACAATQASVIALAPPANSSASGASRIPPHGDSEMTPTRVGGEEPRLYGVDKGLVGSVIPITAGKNHKNSPTFGRIGRRDRRAGYATKFGV